ncbi:hypothetical protein NL108_009691 [Boleophthalmus pectinirostris]|nr:hypothetical protein NL108_009691 [Boleophthalmus pectinirostris]
MTKPSPTKKSDLIIAWHYFLSIRITAHCRQVTTAHGSITFCSCSAVFTCATLSLTRSLTAPSVAPASTCTTSLSLFSLSLPVLTPSGEIRHQYIRVHKDLPLALW